MNVSLTPELDRLVADKVATGRYGSASEVVREALRLMEERDHARSVHLEALNRELEERIRSLDRGERVSGNAARARIERKSQERRSSQR